MKIEIGRTTVASILPEEGIEPAPEREKKRIWKQFSSLGQLLLGSVAGKVELHAPSTVLVVPVASKT